MRVVIIGCAESGLDRVKCLREEGLVPEDAQAAIYEKSCFASFGQEKLEEFCTLSLEDIAAAYHRQEERIRQSGAALHLLTEALLVDPRGKVVTVQRRESGTPEQIRYDLLILATGRPRRVPDLAGKELQGVLALQGLEDLLYLKEFLKSRYLRDVVLFGGKSGGTLGKTLAGALDREGKQVTVLPPGERGCRLTGDLFVDGVVTDKRRMDCDLFVSLEEDANAAPYLRGLPAATAPDGRLYADKNGKTAYDGIYAAGSLVRIRAD